MAFRDADGVAQIRLNFTKRYITLAPVANLVSLAFDLHDPDHILGGTAHPGITIILLEKGTPGLELGDHHLPISAFDNGPIIGRDVDVPATHIIGGPENAGAGWRMLMEQLSGGRSVSLPAAGVAATKLAAAAAGPYSIVREQFGMPIGAMAGVQAKIARLSALAYAMESARVAVCAGIDNGHQPPVISAILKQQTTEIGRQAVIDGLDVMAGAGVMQGPNNILGGSYIGAPVNITVEGANILARTLIIFGQGAVRCHPFALKTLDAMQNNDASAFRRAVLGWVGHTTKNFCRGVVRGLTRGATVRGPIPGETAQYVRKLDWAAARFAFLTDLALFLIGGQLKSRGQLSGRFADALSWMVFSVTTLRRFEAEGRRSEDLPVVHWALRYSLQQIQQAFEGIYANFDVPVLGWLLRYPGRLWLRINPLSTGPSDAMDRAVAAAIQKPGAQYERITLAGLGTPQADEPGLGCLLHAWRLVSDARPATLKVRKALHKRQIEAKNLLDALDPAVETGLISTEEAGAIRLAEAARLAAIQVDVFSPKEYYRDGTSRDNTRSSATTAHAANE